MIRLLIYFALNEWQVRNDTLHEKKEKTAIEERRTQLKEMTFKTYEAHRRSDHRALRRYFKRPYLETITKEMTRRLYDEDAKTEGSIRRILDDQGVHIDELHQITQAEE